MNVVICMDPDIIRGLYDDPFVQDRYADSSYYGWKDAENVFYLAGIIDERPAMCAMCIIKNAWDIEVHLCIPGERRRLGAEFSEAVIAWLFAHAPINRISTSVVSIFPQVAAFARRLGFTQEGTQRGACHREGVFLDLWQFSLLRGEPYGRR